MAETRAGHHTRGYAQRRRQPRVPYLRHHCGHTRGSAGAGVSGRRTFGWVSAWTVKLIYISMKQWNNACFGIHNPDVRLRKLADEKDELLSQVWVCMKWLKMDYLHRWVVVTHLCFCRSENWRCSWRKKDKSTQRSTVFTQKESEWRTALTCILSRCRVRIGTHAMHTLKSAYIFPLL